MVLIITIFLVAVEFKHFPLRLSTCTLGLTCEINRDYSNLDSLLKQIKLKFILELLQI